MNAIRRYRETTGQTQQQLAARLGITKSTVSKIERGALRPAERVALELEELTGVPFKVLRGLVPQDESVGR